MRSIPLALFALCAAAIAAAIRPAPAAADTVNLPTVQASQSTSTLTQVPRRGQTMADVRKTFGTPSKKHPTVGGHAPQRPPITRWDYPDFSVVFERNQVIDAVVPGHPPKLYHVQQLQRGQ